MLVGAFYGRKQSNLNPKFCNICEDFAKKNLGGAEVNTAARLASKAAAGEIIISEAALAKAQVDGSELESRKLELKGISEPITGRVMRV